MQPPCNSWESSPSAHERRSGAGWGKPTSCLIRRGASPAAPHSPREQASLGQGDRWTWWGMQVGQPPTHFAPQILPGRLHASILQPRLQQQHPLPSLTLPPHSQGPLSLPISPPNKTPQQVPFHGKLRWGTYYWEGPARPSHPSPTLQAVSPPWIRYARVASSGHLSGVR